LPSERPWSLGGGCECRKHASRSKLGSTLLLFSAMFCLRALRTLFRPYGRPHWIQNCTRFSTSPAATKHEVVLDNQTIYITREMAEALGWKPNQGMCPPHTRVSTKTSLKVLRVFNLFCTDGSRLILLLPRQALTAVGALILWDAMLTMSRATF
jgi:hypothetical protein